MFGGPEDQIEGQTSELTQLPACRIGLSRAHAGTDTMFGIPIRNVQRETFNSQLSSG